MAEAVFSVRPAFSRAASIRAIAASNLLVSAFAAEASSTFGVSAGADDCSTSEAGFPAAGFVGCSAVGVAVSVEARGLAESSKFPASGFTCSFVVVVEAGASACTVAAPPNII